VGNGPDPDDSIQWNSKYVPTSAYGPCCNWPAYFHLYAFQRQIDALTNAGVATIDPAKRRAIYFQIQAMLADQLPVLFLYWRSQEMLIPADLQGFTANPFASPLCNVGTWRRG
jgi:ABC-type transport system substrate-binding protein